MAITQKYLDEKFERVYDLITKQGENTARLSEAFAVHCNDNNNKIEAIQTDIKEIQDRPTEKLNHSVNLSAIWLSVFALCGLVVDIIQGFFHKGGH